MASSQDNVADDEHGGSNVVNLDHGDLNHDDQNDKYHLDDGADRLLLLALPLLRLLPAEKTSKTLKLTSFSSINIFMRVSIILELAPLEQQQPICISDLA